MFLRCSKWWVWLTGLLFSGFWRRVNGTFLSACTATHPRGRLSSCTCLFVKEGGFFFCLRLPSLSSLSIVSRSWTEDRLLTVKGDQGLISLFLTHPLHTHKLIWLKTVEEVSNIFHYWDNYTRLIAFLWKMTPCILLNKCQCFRETCCPIISVVCCFTLKMEAVHFSETYLPI